MSRIPRKNISTPFLHIMIQGNNKNFILKNDQDKEKYIKILKEYKEENNIIIAYCIMENHVHLLVYTEDMDNLSKFMQKVNQTYAQYYNKKYDKVGHVFRDRYRIQPIMSEKHLITCIDYIHNNPVKAEMCKKASDYKYSSYNNNMFQGNSNIEIKIRKYINSKKMLYLDKDKGDFILLEDDGETKEDFGKEMLEKYLLYYNISLDELQKNNELLIKIIKNLKNKYNISYRVLSQLLGIGREKIRMLIKNNK